MGKNGQKMPLLLYLRPYMCYNIIPKAESAFGFYFCLSGTVGFYCMKGFARLSPRTKGIICIIIAAFGFSMMSVCVRGAGELPSFQKAFFRNFAALFVVAGIMLRKKISFIPQKGSIGLLIGRALFGTVGILGNFYAIDHMVLADANMLNKLSPFFAIVFSALLLKERPNFVQIIGVLAAMAGSMLIIKPGFASASVFPALAGLAGGLGAGVAYTFVRMLGARGEKGLRIVLFFSAFSCIVCLPFMLIHFEPMSVRQVLFLLLAGLCACVGQFGITQAYIYAPAKEISVYDYTQVIFAALLGFAFFEQVPDILSVLGYVLICASGVGMFFYNKKHGVQTEKKEG